MCKAISTMFIGTVYIVIIINALINILEAKS